MANARVLKHLRRWSRRLNQMNAQERGRKLRDELGDYWMTQVVEAEMDEPLPLALQRIGMMLEQEANYEEFMRYLYRHEAAIAPTETREGIRWLHYILKRYDPDSLRDRLEEAAN